MSAIEKSEEGKATASKPKNKKKLIIIGAAAAALLLGGGGGAYAFLSGGSGDEAHAEDTHGGKSEKKDSGGEGHGEGGENFVDVPPMVVNLRSADGGTRFIKLHFMLVPQDTAGAEALKSQLPLLLDAYQPFLRELRPEDLAGSAAVFRIKEEMLIRANDTLGTGHVKDVLIQDLIQQ